MPRRYPDAYLGLKLLKYSERMGLTADELLKDAIDNMRLLIRPLSEFIPLKIMEELVASGCPEPVSPVPMYVISNRDLYCQLPHPCEA